MDLTFNGDGKVITNSGGSFNDLVRATAIQPNGKIVAVGESHITFGQMGATFMVVRYNANGTLDATFSGDGRQRTNFGANEYANAIELQADGKIVLAGRREAANGCSFALARYSINGTLDATFSGDGKVATFLPSTSCGWWQFLGWGFNPPARL